jgi:hypothetical protein
MQSLYTLFQVGIRVGRVCKTRVTDAQDNLVRAFPKPHFGRPVWQRTLPLWTNNRVKARLAARSRSNPWRDIRPGIRQLDAPKALAGIRHADDYRFPRWI